MVCQGAAYFVARHPNPRCWSAGTYGPDYAELLHLKEFTRTTVGVASLGGAGAFDGIILFGILAALHEKNQDP
jgi:uncharacterized membrane protein